MITKSKISIREDFRRDGISMTFLADEDIMFNLAKSFPGSILNIGYPAICEKEEEMCTKITDTLAHIDVETAVVGHARKDHLDKMAKITNLQSNTSANFWIPISDYMISQTLKQYPEEVLTNSIELIKYWKNKSDHPLDIAIADCTANEKNLRNRIKLFYESLKEAGARNIIFCDTRGIATPRKLLDILTDIKKENGIEYHPHNDNSQALSCIETVINLGVSRIGTAAFGFGERGSMIDPRDIATKYPINYNPDEFNLFKRKFNDLIRNLEEKERIFYNGMVITGTQYRLRKRDPNLELKFGISSDKHILSQILKIKQEEISDTLLRTIKNNLYIDKKRIFNTVELEVKYAKYK